jgi:myo-inositol-1(or 4)-monophosphatase
MGNNTVFLTDAIRGASKFLHRDYFELENLQSSEKNTKIFVDKAKQRVAENLQKSLSKYYKTIIFDNELNLQNLSFSDSAVLVHVLDGEANFERAIPFFALIVTILTKKHDKISADKIVVNFPILGDIYYAEQGKGAWLERHSANFSSGAVRLRVSVKNKLEDRLVCCNYSELPIAAKISPNIRIFESCAYQLALLISGKADVALFLNNPIFTQGFEMLVRESGGLSYVQNNVFIASNYQLQEKLKQILA